MTSVIIFSTFQILDFVHRPGFSLCLFKCWMMDKVQSMNGLSEWQIVTHTEDTIWCMFVHASLYKLRKETN